MQKSATFLATDLEADSVGAVWCSAHRSNGAIQPNSATIGGVLRTLRTGRRLTMEQAAQQAGIHRATLHRWEKGQVQPRLAELEALLGVLGASPTQRRQVVTLMDAPRAQALVRAQIHRIAQQSGLGTMPHGGDLLRAMRLRRGWSLEEIAARIRRTPATLRRWEKAEIWPSVEHLHTLCYALEAQEEEVIALTCGPFSRLATTAETTVQAMEERIYRFDQTIYDPPSDLKDLELLAMETEAWRLAVRSAAGVRLLADVCALSYHHQAYQDRHVQAVAAAERYFDLVPVETRDRRAQSKWQGIRLGSTWDRLKAGGRATPKQCLNELKMVLPLTLGVATEPEALHLISAVLLQLGVWEEALQVSEQACEAATRTMGDHGNAWFRGLMGTHLIRLGHFAEGLPLLSTGDAGDRYRLVETSLWKVEAYLGLRETGEAERWLARAQSDLARWEIRALQPRLDALNARL